MESIGFIGVGIMGKSMVRNLMKHGYPVSIYARSRAKVEDVIAEGARFCQSIADCAANSRVIITIVGFPADVEEVYFQEYGILGHAKPGTYLIDMTTSSPKLAERIDAAAKGRGLVALDAPVTGGDVGAKNGTLSILVGGDKEAFVHCLPIFRAMGSNINYEGPAGFGQHTKMANQILIAGALSGVCEAMAYARAKGLNLDTMLQSLKTGAAGSRQLDLMAPKIIAEDYSPGFYIKHFIKDMKLAQEEALASQLSLDVLSRVLELYQSLAAAGDGELGTQALMKHYLQ